MKKGLRRHLHLVSPGRGMSRSPKGRPDEEGIETLRLREGHIWAVGRPKGRPDEEGIETP